MTDQHSVITERAPTLTARHTLSRAQKTVGVLLAVLLAGGIAVNASTTFQALNTAAIALYLVCAYYKLSLQFISVRELRHQIPTVKIPESDLPVYTVLVPLYHEKTAVSGLVAHLKKLEYPKDKLQILLLVEEDDRETRDAVAALAIQAPFEEIVVPVSLPRTKPKACNVGLRHARGDILVIFDAEDRPETDQLLKAVSTFSNSPGNVICLQAALNYYNRDRNFLTRLFTTEYSTWFDYCLPGLFSLDAPIPLGGTSNHFRLGELRTLGGWDPYNVTEDCDLGIRLYIAGYRTGMLNSTTWEEATFRILPWIRQRSRWIKGYIQTYMVHLRQHSELARNMGWQRTMHFHFLFGTTFFCLLMNPFYWFLTLLWFITQYETIRSFFPFWIMVPAMVSFFAGNAAFVLSAMLGCLQRRYYHLIPYCLLIPFYWVLMSVGAWKGALQLIGKPFYWEKTPHEGTAVLETRP